MKLKFVFSTFLLFILSTCYNYNSNYYNYYCGEYANCNKYCFRHITGSNVLHSETLPPKKPIKKSTEDTLQVKQLKELLPDKSEAPIITGKIFIDSSQALKIKNEESFSNLLSDFSVDYKNKTTVLVFWEHNCGFCLLTIPEIEKLNKKFKDKNVVFYAVNPKDLQKKKKFITFFNNYKNQRINFNEVAGTFTSSVDTNMNNSFSVPILFVNEKTKNDFLVTGFPTTYVIDKNGLIYTAMTGYFKEYGEWLDFLLSNMPK